MGGIISVDNVKTINVAWKLSRLYYAYTLKTVWTEQANFPFNLLHTFTLAQQKIIEELSNGTSTNAEHWAPRQNIYFGHKRNTAF